MFQSYYERERIDTVRDPDGIEWTIWDVQYLYEARLRLSPRQTQAIEMCLYENVKEAEAAVKMGISPNSPVCKYADNGLKKIVSLIEDGHLPKFRHQAEEAAA